MATKKYLDLTGLSKYDEKIKAWVQVEDATELAAAKAYADGLASNYDAAGSAATALADAKTYADGKIAPVKATADAAQADVDALEELVGTLPEDTDATTVIGYVDKKTSGIATDAALGELQGKVNTIVGTDTGKSARAIAAEEIAAQLIPENAGESLDTLQEIAAWIQAHPGDASAMNAAITALETLVGEIPEGVTATTVTGYVQELVNALDTRVTTAETDIDALQAASHTHANKVVLDGITADKVTAWDGAEQNAKDYADGLVGDFVAITDAEVDALFLAE